MTGLDELRKRYPWPDVCPPLEFDDGGWCDDDVHRVMRNLITKDMKLVVEIGSWFGKSSRVILGNLSPDATLICVDGWRGSPEGSDSDPNLKRLYAQFLRNQWEERHRVIPLRNESPSGLHEIASVGLKPDLIYIDASHLYDYCFIDTATSYRLFPKAQLVGHDWCDMFRGVKKAVTELAQLYGWTIEVDGWVWWVKHGT